MPTILCFKEHSADGLVWWVRHRGRWKTARSVIVEAPFHTMYRGKGAKQPTAYLEFYGEVTITGKDDLWIGPKNAPLEAAIRMNTRYVSTFPIPKPVRARREAK